MLSSVLSDPATPAYVSSLAVLLAGSIGAWATIRANRRTSDRLNGAKNEPSIEELRQKVKRQDRTIEQLGAEVQEQNDRLKYQDGQIASYSDALRACEDREKALRSDLRKRGVL